MLAALVAAVLALAAAPAAAHDGPALIALEGVHPSGQSVHYVARVTWEDDGHPAADATVTATAVGPDGTTLTPVTLAAVDDDGRYAGVVDYPTPGTWTVRITSIEPTGSLEQSQVVSPSETTTTAPGDDGSGDEGSSAAGDDETADEGGFAAADDGTGASADDESAAGGGSGDDGMPVYLLVAAALVVVIGAATAVGVIRRRGDDPVLGTADGADEPGSDEPDTGEPDTGDVRDDRAP